MTSTSLPPPTRPPPIPSKRAPYPHIHDLIARTNTLDPTQRASIRSWLEYANILWVEAKWHRTSGILDAALVNYLLAFTICAEIIPRCPEYPTFSRAASSKLLAEYQELRQTLESCSPEYTKIKDAIKKDNEISGIASVVDQLATPAGNPSEMPNGDATHRVQNGDKTAPEVRAKPRHLVSKSVSPQLQSNGNTSSTPDELQSRFNKLSFSPKNGGRPSSVPPNGLPTSLIPGFGRPHGPREMPSPGPLRVDVKNVMPRLPAPVYSPSTSYGSPGGIPPQRSSRSQSIVADIVKPKLPLTTDISLTAEALFAFLKAGGISVLLLDIRPREEFNQGHIFSRSTVCIEPITLREGMSADDLEDSLIVSPQPNDHDIFKARNHCDLVVYYDQSTPDTSYLHSAPSRPSGKALQILHAALHEYNYSKPLKQPPLLLAGGLDAWIEIAGPQSLKITSAAPSKAASPAPSLYRRSQQVMRAPTPLLMERRTTGISQTPPPYPTSPYDGGLRVASAHMPAEPIDLEEEQKWLERLRKERDPVSLSADEEALRRREPTAVANNTGGGGYVRTVEEFFQQYPATSPHGQESMMPKDPESLTSLRRNNTIIDHPFHVFTDVRNSNFNPPTSPARPPPVAARKSYSGVSERLATALHPAVPPRPPKVPLSAAMNCNIGTTGLKNLGNTCYMNSILQCMSGTVPISRYFLDGSYKLHINKNNPLGSRGLLAEAYATVLKHLWGGEYNFISPVTFRDVAGRLNETFRSDQQQDAQEFLDFLLDGLHEDLNPNANKTKLKPLTEKQELQRERLPIQVASIIEWQRYTHLNSSVTVNWLQGQLSSRLTCQTCFITSTTYNPFMYLSLPIPILNRQFTLLDCLNEFTKEEVLDGDDAWHCPNCKAPRRATKKLTITRLPPILIIHLKRFTNQGRWRDKLNTPIRFSLTDLNLTEYVPPPLPPEEMGKHDVQPTAETTPPFIYDLYGIANHYGTLHGGHYTAFVKNSYKGVWNSFDDSKATVMDESQVVSRNAYVLFWVRKHVM